MPAASNQKRYYVFSKSAFAKSARATPHSMRRAATRGEARLHKQGDQRLGIWDTLRDEEVR